MTPAAIAACVIYFLHLRLIAQIGMHQHNSSLVLVMSHSLGFIEPNAVILNHTFYRFVLLLPLRLLLLLQALQVLTVLRHGRFFSCFINGIIDHELTLLLSHGSHHAVPLTESEMLQLLQSMSGMANEKLGLCMSFVQNTSNNVQFCSPILEFLGILKSFMLTIR